MSPPGDKPTLQTVFTDNATVEALGALLDINNRGFLQVNDELTAHFDGMNQYKGGKGSDPQFYNTVFSGQPLKVDRKGALDEPLFVPKPFMCIVGGIQPDVLNEVGSDKNEGSRDRFLIAYPDPMPQFFDRSKTISPESKQRYEDLYMALARVSLPTLNGRIEPLKIQLSKEAEGAFDAELNRIYAEAEDPEMPIRLRGVWKKLSTYLARFCLILAVCRFKEAKGLTEETPSVNPLSTAVNGIDKPKSADGLTDDRGDRDLGYTVNHGVTEAEWPLIDILDVTNAAKLIEYFKGMALRAHVEIYKKTVDKPEDSLAAALITYLQTVDGYFKDEAGVLYDHLKAAGVSSLPDDIGEFGRKLTSIVDGNPSLILHRGNIKKAGKSKRCVELTYTPPLSPPSTVNLEPEKPIDKPKTLVDRGLTETASSVNPTAPVHPEPEPLAKPEGVDLADQLPEGVDLADQLPDYFDEEDYD